MVNIIESRSMYRHSEKKSCSNRYIHPVMLSICRKLGGGRILDVGCGNGSLCRSLVDAGFDVVGAEPSRSGVVAARALVPEGMFYEKSVYDDPSDMLESDFDVVVSTEVIEHLFSPRFVPEFAYEKLRDDGFLVVSTPYHGFLKNLLIAVTNKWDSHHTALWDGGHIKFWSRQSLTTLLESKGFRVFEFHGVGRLPWLWKSMILVAQKESRSSSLPAGKAH